MGDLVLALTPAPWRICTALGCLVLLGGCATAKFTVDDGRAVDEALLNQIVAFGKGERVLRPAIVRSSQLSDPSCDKQWELPFSVATSADWSSDDRVAWVRALGVDERLTVIATAADSPLAPGERIEAVEGYARAVDAESILAALGQARDSGGRFRVRTDNRASVEVTPVEVCRGYTRLAPPNSPKIQDYHWLMSMHPLEIVQADLTDDEALWAVLWTQGLSEEGGLRMKAYHYTTSIASTLYSLATLASGLKGAALAAEAAMSAAKSAAATVASEVLKRQLIEQAQAFAAKQVRQGLVDTAERLTQQQVVSAMQRVALHRGALAGVARVGATVFDRADLWAFHRAEKLGGNPLAGFMLHQKLLERGLTNNALAFDIDRLSALSETASSRGLGESVVAILRGVRPGDLGAVLGAMPLASSSSPFSYDGAAYEVSGPFTHGLVNAMLEMPLQTRGQR